MSEDEVQLGTGIKVPYHQRSAWTLKLVQLALKTMDDRQAALQIPEEERVFRTGDIERETKELDPSGVGVNRSTFGKNLDVAAAIAKARRLPPPTLPDLVVSANMWIQPDPDEKTRTKRRAYLMKAYSLDELIERRVALSELLHHLVDRRELLEKYKFDDEPLKEYPNPPFCPKATAMELYLYLRTVACKKDMVREIADLEEQIAEQRAHIQTYDCRYIEQVRKRRKPVEGASKKGEAKPVNGANVADNKTRVKTRAGASAGGS